jgi:hypothetical protein
LEKTGTTANRTRIIPVRLGNRTYWGRSPAKLTHKGSIHSTQPTIKLELMF